MGVAVRKAPGTLGQEKLSCLLEVARASMGPQPCGSRHSHLPSDSRHPHISQRLPVVLWVPKQNPDTGAQVTVSVCCALRTAMSVFYVIDTVKLPSSFLV